MSGLGMLVFIHPHPPTPSAFGKSLTYQEAANEASSSFYGAGHGVLAGLVILPAWLLQSLDLLGKKNRNSPLRC